MMPFVPYFLGEEPVPYAAAARHLGPEVRARRRQAQRPRRHRPLAAPPQLLRDARQLQLRRLLQGRRDPVGLGVLHRDARPRRRPDLGHLPRRRRRGRRDLGRRGRLPDRAHPAPRQGQLLGDGRHRPVRPVLRAVLGLRPRAWAPTAARPTRRPRTATSSSGTSCSRSTSGGADGALSRPRHQEHRHRRRPRAHPRRHHRLARRVRHRRAPPPWSARPSRLTGDRLGADPQSPTSPCSCWPTTPAP